MAHTLTIFEPIWPMLQNLSKLWFPVYMYMHDLLFQEIQMYRSASALLKGYGCMLTPSLLKIQWGITLVGWVMQSFAISTEGTSCSIISSNIVDLWRPDGWFFLSIRYSLRSLAIKRWGWWCHFWLLSMFVAMLPISKTDKSATDISVIVNFLYSKTLSFFDMAYYF